MDWFKGTFTGNHGIYHEIWVFPVKFPLNQSIDIPAPFSSQVSSPHGTSWNYAPQLGKVTPTCSPIFLTQHENEQVRKNDHPKCAKHHENASKRMLGRLSREVPPTKRKILDRAG